ncbi:SDR family NAD(P)-dependent oxidoreductase [Sphingomonas sp. ZB1N12]|uniref:SDR family NAD(P)-dependent oxidoreductase n=1 Tax=Sphingomonas arabinosi TaxID=3096160 RepID=UPI002FC93646
MAGGGPGIGGHEDRDALDVEDFIDLYGLNTIAPFQMVPALRASPMGAVVSVASVAGVFGMGLSVAPADSKGALVMMTKTLARVLAPRSGSMPMRREP